MALQDKITVELTRNEALVLFEFLRRSDDEGRYAFVDQAEHRVIWNLECMVERQLSETLDPMYRELLESAWDQIRDRCG